jgi:CubicO group peptidase (beta-lactamase class C family)
MPDAILDSMPPDPPQNPSPDRPKDAVLDDDLLPITRRAMVHRVAVGQAEGKAPALIAAMARGGRMAWWGGRGMSQAHDPDADTQFRIGSISKTLVAITVMRLRDEGLLDLADPLRKHLDPPSPAGDPTVVQLLSHTSGLVAEADGPWWERTTGELRPALADIFPAKPQAHPAGRVFHYSNPGYALLGGLISKVRGRPWGDVVRDEVLEPLGLTRTTLLPQPLHERGWAVHPWADLMQPEPSEDIGLMAPAGQYWSTAADLCRLAAFLLDPDERVLASQTLAEMRAPASGVTDDDWDGSYGLGLQLVRSEGRLMYGHFGSMPGFVAGVLVSPKDGIGAVALANSTSGPAIGRIVVDLIAAVAEHEPKIPARWQPLPDVDRALLELTGPWYWGPRAYMLHVRADRGLELTYGTGGGRGSRFRAEPDGTWTGLDDYFTGETLRLVRGDDGAVDHINVGNFVFIRAPYGETAPLAARPDPAGWQPGQGG